MRNQLVKDLEGFNCGVCPHKARLKEKGIKTCWEADGGDCDKYALEWAANRLIELGYVKVVRCGQCKYQRDCERIIIRSNDVGAEEIDYCSEGEAKEAGE